MPNILVAGTIASKPQSLPFPKTGKPRATVEIDVDRRKYFVVAYDLKMAEIEALMPGDAVSIQGNLIVETGRGGTITGLHVEARQTMALRQRSINRLPVQMARQSML